MWPCNSIIIAFVWFVTHGEWPQAFHHGYCLRLVIHAGFKVTPQHWMESQREGVSSSQCVSKTQVLWWTWGQWWCPSRRAPGHPAQDSEGTAPEPRKCLHHPLCSLCFPVGLCQQRRFTGHESSRDLGCAFTHLRRRSGITWSMDLCSDCPQQPPEFSRGLLRSVSPCPSPPTPTPAAVQLEL